MTLIWEVGDDPQIWSWEVGDGQKKVGRWIFLIWEVGDEEIKVGRWEMDKNLIIIRNMLKILVRVSRSPRIIESWML